LGRCHLAFFAVGLYRKLGFVEAPHPEPSSGLAGMAYMIRGKTGH
jgi:hypothetical protein